MTNYQFTNERRAAILAKAAANKAARLAHDEAEAVEAAKAAETAEQAKPAPLAEPADAEADVGDEETGYKKPPRRTRFKKGQSGNPSGGWPQRRARAAAREEAARKERQVEDAARKAREDDLPRRLKRLFQREIQVTVDGEPTTVTAIEAQLMKLEVEARTCAKARAQYLKLAQQLGVLDKPPEKQQVGVVVVSAPLTTEQWLEKARATKLPMDPLEGLPGIPKNIDRTKGRSADTLDDDQH